MCDEVFRLRRARVNCVAGGREAWHGRGGCAFGVQPRPGRQVHRALPVSPAGKLAQNRNQREGAQRRQAGAVKKLSRNRVQDNL